MYLLDVERLSEDLRYNRVSELDKYRYVLASTGLSLLFGVARAVTMQPGPGHAGALAIQGIIALVGLHLTFKTNAAGDNRHFLDRYMCLSVPLMIWSYIFYFVLFYVNYIAASFVFGQNVDHLFYGATPLNLVLSSMMSVAYFSGLRHFIRKSARG